MTTLLMPNGNMIHPARGGVTTAPLAICPIIGIAGKRGSGKDTVANLILALLPGEYTQDAFAENLKTAAYALCGGYYNKDEFVKSMGCTFGRFLQIVGMDARKNYGEDVWVNALFNGLRPDQKLVISDVRLPNEAEAIKRRGGIVVRVSGDPNGVRGNGMRDDSHISETALDDYDFDYEIINGGSKEGLESHVIDMLHKLVVAPNTTLR